MEIDLVDHHDGFDTTTLLSAWATAPYLHDGSAATLADAIASHASAVDLSNADLSDIARYIAELETNRSPIRPIQPIRSIRPTRVPNMLALYTHRERMDAASPHCNWG
ncbi:MAG: hypothetical protein R3A47_04390 [Polyangiales bacterium]